MHTFLCGGEGEVVDARSTQEKHELLIISETEDVVKKPLCWNHRKFDQSAHT